MIKYIQPRGISRNPSDAEVKDGGCEESLNMYIDQDENAVVAPAKDMTSELGLPSGNRSANIQYIHIAGGRTNYIGTHELTNLRVGVYYCSTDGVTAGEWQGPLFTVNPEEDESVTGFQSIGNTLIVTTTTDAHYLLFKDGAYKYLGTRIPVPDVRFQTELQTDTHADDTFSFIGIMNDAARAATKWDNIGTGSGSISYKEWWENCISLYETNADVKSFVDQFTEKLFALIKSREIEYRASKYFTHPILVKCALRLHDGQYLEFMQPVLLTGAMTNTWFTESDTHGSLGPLQPVINFLSFELCSLYTASISPNTGGALRDWKDIVSSIDLFYSTDISNPSVNARPITADANGEYCSHTYKGQESNNDADNFENRFVDAANFYLVRSFNLEFDFSDVALSPISQDDLVVKNTLPIGDPSTYFPKFGAMAYNGRLILKGAAVGLPVGYRDFPAIISIGSSAVYFSVFFHIKDNYGVDHIVKAIESGSVAHIEDSVLALLMYPNPNCWEAEVYKKASATGLWTDRYIYEMKEHPNLDCAYFFGGLDKKLTETGSHETNASGFTLPTENARYDEPNKLYMSEVDNPFVFPLSERKRFDGDLIDIAVAVSAMSPGQYGDFPLYGFTSRGIWALRINADGTLGTPEPLSGDVAIKGTICPIDQAVVFVTKKGVMLAYGSKIRCISPFMIGKHYTIESDAETLIRGSAWAPLADILAENTPFMDFMSRAKAVYDYPGNRVIFMNNAGTVTRKYQYVYHIASDTWHKISLPIVNSLESFARALNSYPEALVAASLNEINESYRFIETDADKIASLIAWLTVNVPYLEDYAESIAEGVENLPVFDILNIREEFEDFLSEEDIHYDTEQESTNASTVYSLSTILDDAATMQSQTRYRGVIITRALDFDAEYIYKTISQLKLRGDYAAGNIKYILLGSQDGINFRVLHSLRGPSWKAFRLIILTNLRPNERLNGIELDVETRFQDKIR